MTDTYKCSNYLDELIIHSHYNIYHRDRINDTILSNNIKKLILKDKNLVPLDSLPSCLTTLVLYEDDKFGLDNLPNSIEYIYMNVYTSRLDCLCVGVKTIIIKKGFNHSVPNLPHTLEELALGDDFSQPIDKLPSGLKILHLGNEFNHAVDKLPQTLERIIFGEKFSQSLDMLPNTIKYISICWIGKFNEKISVLPKDLEELHLNNNFSQTICRFPIGIKKISFGHKFSNWIILPDTSVILKIPSDYKYINELRIQYRNIIITYQ